MRCIPKLAAAALAGLTGFAGPALAADAANYDYLAARYTLLGEVSGNGGDEDVTGLSLEGSRSISEDFYVRIVSDMYNVDTSGSADSALDFFSVGPGIQVDLNTPGTTTLFGQLNYERVSAFGAVGTGFGIDVGVRMQLDDRIEAGVTVSSTSTESGSTDIDYDTWEIEGVYALNRQVDVTASLVNGDIDIDSTSLDLENLVRIGVRMPF
jgi:hypothetical protein